MTSSSNPLIDFTNLIERGEIVFFVGSGISLSYPACLPSAQQLLDSCFSRYLTQASKEERRELLKLIWPEVFYQELMAFIGDAALHPFKVLAYKNAKPTLAHYLIVETAASGKAPVVTTNFDLLLEQAAKRLNLNINVIGPDGPFSFRGEELSIWKMHGSIGAPEQGTSAAISATVSQITQPNTPLLTELKELFTTRHVCFVGYSGRDLDLFPMIKDFPEIKLPFWVDPSPSAQLKDRAKAMGAVLIQNKLEDILTTQCPKFINTLKAKEISMAEFTPVDISAHKLHTEIANELGKQQLKMQALTLQQQTLLLGICFYRIGKYRSALDILIGHEADLRVQLCRADRALLFATIARLCDFVSDYYGSEKYARLTIAATKPRQEPTDFQISALRIEGMHAISMAKKMQLGPNFSYGIPEVDFAPNRIRSLNVLARYVWLDIKMKRQLRLLTKSGAGAKADVWKLVGWHWYLDHRLVLQALVAAATPQYGPLKCLVSKWNFWFLHRIKKVADKNGDFAVLASVQKHLQRHGFVFDADLVFAFDTYSLAVDPLNAALIHRNNGDIYIKEGRNEEAISEYEKALQLAEKCGSKATVLKALVGLQICGRRIRDADFSRRIEGLSGYGYEQFAEQFRRILV